MPPDLAREARRLGIRLMEAVRRTEALRLLPGLEASQWWSTPRLQELQRERLRELLRFCGREVPHWRATFASLGLDPERQEPAAVLAALPPLDKDAVRDLGSRLRSDSFARWQPRRKATSGSTGRPLTYFLDRPSHSYQWAHLWRGWGQFGFRPGDRYATLSGGSLVPEKVDLKQRVYLALSGAVHLPSYHLTPALMDLYAHRLRRERADFLYGYPSSLELFADHLLERAAGVPLRAVFTTSEMLSPRARGRLEAAFGCPAVDTYGCNDGGVYAAECPRREGYHVGMESVVVEVLDGRDRPLPEGEVGQLVTTNLVMRAMPLLRYRTGDLGSLTTRPCACGRGLVRLADLQGRERDFVTTPAGRRVHGAFFNHFEPFYRAEWLRRFQVQQTAPGSLTLRLSVSREPTSAEREAILSELRRGLGEMEFQLVLTDEMLLTRTGKFRVVVNELAQPTGGPAEGPSQGGAGAG